ncbi:MAG: hypothetical protein FWF07_03685, partial [Methanomassiliicoccaceae archaeon]|nr:hypothetical protein [Methanomassiliicoccaceae archaeon]
SVEIYSYRTNIHVLIGELFNGNQLDEDIDLLQHLISRENDKTEKEKLQRRFTDVFLIFDMDMHDERADTGRLETMLKVFNDSANNGKLYINYPMMESYRHLRSLNDEEFKDRCVAVSLFSDYKQIVDKECHKGLKNVNEYNVDIFRVITHAHLKKGNYVLGREYVLPSVEEFNSWEGADILEMQRRKMNADRSVFVLNLGFDTYAHYL